MDRNLLGAIGALVLWVVLAFVLRTGGGYPHALLAVGTVLLVRWIALRDPRPIEK